MKARKRMLALASLAMILTAGCLFAPGCDSITTSSDNVQTSSADETGAAADSENGTGDTDSDSGSKSTGQINGALTDDSVAQTDEITPSISTKSETKTLTITATGDCTFGKTQDHSYDGSFYEYYDSYGEDYFFEGVRDVFLADDMTVINLECVLTTSEDRVEKTFNLKGAPEYVGIMTGSSVEACSMGNNHTYDYGESGFQETKQVLEDAGITYAYSEQAGTYTTEEGVKVGMVSASLLSQSAEKLDKLKEQIQELRADGAEVIIACCHWGIERDYYPNDYQQTTAHELIDAGADLVIGNHPHVLQGVEEYEGKLILYSLGNFCFGGNKNPSDKNTMMFRQTFTIVDGEVQTDDIDAKIIPCRLSSANSYNDYQPTIATGDTKQTIIDLVNEYSAPYSGVSFDSEGTLKLSTQ